MVSSNSRRRLAGGTSHIHERDRDLGRLRVIATQPVEAPVPSVQCACHEVQRVPVACALQCSDRTGDALIQVNDLLEAEVRRIAHALHDEAGQTLTAVHLKLAEIERQTFSLGALGFVEIRQLLDRIEAQLRQFSHELRPLILDDFGLVPALESLAETYGKRTGLDIAVIATARERFPVALETALYRIVQEALINVNRHARARCITVKIEVEPQMVHCCVSDDGAGFDCESARSGGLGLLGIRERLANLGGRLTITSRIGFGTRIAVAIPMAIHKKNES